MEIEERVRRFIERERLLNKKRLYLVAVSGGADSVCLLLMLKELGYDVEAVHCNFNLRGDESLRDENFVKELCQNHNIELHITHFDTKTYAELHKVSIEMSARQLRYRYFEQLRVDIGAADICVAHHQDDTVETVLMNLLRGTGIRGLQGIQPRRDHIVRPLLCLSRRDIEQWLHERYQPYVTDSTNLVPDVVRNQLRLNVIPELQKVSPAATANILATARRLGEAARVYDHAIGESLRRLLHDDPSSSRQSGLPDSEARSAICIDELLREPSPESVLYEWLSPAGFSPTTIESICQSLPSLPSGREWRSATHWLVSHRGSLLLAPVSRSESNVSDAFSLPSSTTLCIPEPGTYVCNDRTKLRITIADGSVVNRDPMFCCVDADKVTFPLVLRPWQAGDRFCPLGMKGSKLVSDYLTDRHLSLIDKRQQTVLCNADGTILWLVGQRVDNRFRITPDTRRTMIIHRD